MLPKAERFRETLLYLNLQATGGKTSCEFLPAFMKSSQSVYKERGKEREQGRKEGGKVGRTEGRNGEIRMQVKQKLRFEASLS